MTIAYLANSFPEPLEPYVWEEIHELRRRGVQVIPCSIRRPKTPIPDCGILAAEVECAFPLQPWAVLIANWLLLRYIAAIRSLLWRVISGKESLSRRLRTLAHIWLGAYMSALLAKKGIRQIHVHHGYFAAWIGVVAARILGAGFSMTLHGSDLLVHGDYLDAKLAACNFCFTISEFNRRYVLDHYAIPPEKVMVRRLGVNPIHWRLVKENRNRSAFSILSVGRLHSVKNHEFLVRACHVLKQKGTHLRCLIVGEGPERSDLEEMIARLRLQREVILLGNVTRDDLPAFYSGADAVVLTSHSEGIPVTLMEAMAMERLVIAPRITGIPELVIDGVNGFLYSPDSIPDFISKLEAAWSKRAVLRDMRQAAREQIERKFNGPENLARFTGEFIALLGSCELPKHMPHEALNELTVEA